MCLYPYTWSNSWSYQYNLVLGAFRLGPGCTNSVGGVWKQLTFLEILRFPITKFYDELPCFSKLWWITSLQTSHETRWHVYTSKNIEIEASRFCTYASLIPTLSPKTAIESSNAQVADSSHPWHHSVDKTHSFFMYSLRWSLLSLSRQSSCKIKRNTFMVDGPSFFFHKAGVEKLGNVFWFSELEDARNICACKDRVQRAKW
jgi:hypothetical protein